MALQSLMPWGKFKGRLDVTSTSKRPEVRTCAHGIFMVVFLKGLLGDFWGLIITHEYPQKKRAYIGVFDRGTLVGVHPTIPSGGHCTLYLLQYLRYIYIYT